jgi:hypothetical protein
MTTLAVLSLSLSPLVLSTSELQLPFYPSFATKPLPNLTPPASTMFKNLFSLVLFDR